MAFSCRRVTCSLRTRIFYPFIKRPFASSSSGKTDIELLKEADSIEHFCDVGAKYMGSETLKMHSLSEDMGFESSVHNSFWLHVGMFCFVI